MLSEVPFDQFWIGSQFLLPCFNLKFSYPDEHCFPTLLSMEDPDECIRYTLTRVNWIRSVGGHPHRYGPAEILPRFIEELRRSNSSYSFMFARKFSPDCLQPLLDMPTNFQGLSLGRNKWHPFMLYPSVPKEGVVKMEAYLKKFGPQAAQIESQMIEVFKGLWMNYDTSGLT